MTLARWDALNQIQKKVGIGELDNHATVKKILCIPLVAFSFNRAFRFIRTHVLTEKEFSGNSQQDISLVYQSLLYGRCYFALEFFREARGFEFVVERDKQKFYMGDQLTLAADTQLSASFPVRALVKIIRNGQEWTRQSTNRLSVRIEEPGVYRVEAYLKSFGKLRPWIYSNPIFIV